VVQRLLVILMLVFAVGTAAAQAGDPEPRPTRQREILKERPSGFWTSNRPAKGGAYRWRLLAIGGGIAAITGFGMLYLIKRAKK
jgi:hypothetical protein